MDIDCHVAFLIESDSFLHVDALLKQVAFGYESVCTQPQFTKRSSKHPLHIDLVIIPERLLELVCHLSCLSLVVPKYARNAPEELDAELHIKLPFANVVS